MPKFSNISLNIATPINKIQAYDYNLDGVDDFLISQENMLSIYLYSKNTFSLNKQITFPTSISGFDIVRFPGTSFPFALVVTKKSIFLYQKGKKIYIDSLDKEAVTDFSHSLFQDCNGDALADIIICYNKNNKWFYRLYFWKKGSYDYVGQISLDSPLLIPPQLEPKDFFMDNHLVMTLNNGKNFSVYSHQNKSFAKTFEKASDNKGEGHFVAADIDKNEPLDFITSFAKKPYIKVQTKKNTFTLKTPGILNFGAYTHDVNNDGWLDVFSITMLKSSWWQMTASFLLTGRASIDFAIYQFNNLQGQFSLQPSQTYYRTLWLPASSKKKKKILHQGDINNDAYPDLVVFKKPSKLLIHYNFKSLPEYFSQTSYLEKIWQYVQNHIYTTKLMQTDIRKEDIALEIASKNVSINKVIPLRSKGKHCNLLVHYKEMESEKIKVFIAK